MSEQHLSRDRWQQTLAQKKLALEQCQTEHALNSCLQCDQLLQCSIREGYVKAVYESMSKGRGGGFEF